MALLNLENIIMKSKKKEKANQRKIKKMMQKKLNVEHREENIKAIQDNKIDKSLSNVLVSSKNFGKNLSLRSKVNNELQKEKLGLVTSPELYTEKIVNEKD